MCSSKQPQILVLKMTRICFLFTIHVTLGHWVHLGMQVDGASTIWRWERHDELCASSCNFHLELAQFTSTQHFIGHSKSYVLMGQRRGLLSFVLRRERAKILVTTYHQ